MKHDEAKSKFNDLLDGLLDEKESKNVLSHIENCATCRKEWDEFRQIFEIFRKVAGVKAPPHLVERTKKKIHKKSRGKFFSPEPFIYRVPHELFSLIIILIALILFLIISQLSNISPGSISTDADTQQQNIENQNYTGTGNGQQKFLNEPSD